MKGNMKWMMMECHFRRSRSSRHFLFLSRHECKVVIDKLSVHMCIVMYTHAVTNVSTAFYHVFNENGTSYFSTIFRVYNFCKVKGKESTILHKKTTCFALSKFLVLQTSKYRGGPPS